MFSYLHKLLTSVNRKSLSLQKNKLQNEFLSPKSLLDLCSYTYLCYVYTELNLTGRSLLFCFKVYQSV